MYFLIWVRGWPHFIHVLWYIASSLHPPICTCIHTHQHVHSLLHVHIYPSISLPPPTLVWVALPPADQAVETEDAKSPHLCHSTTCWTSPWPQRREETRPVMAAWPPLLCSGGGELDRGIPTTRSSSYKQSECWVLDMVVDMVVLLHPYGQLATCTPRLALYLVVKNALPPHTVFTRYWTHTPSLLVLLLGGVWVEPMTLIWTPRYAFPICL